jgi:hypothetical protein
MYWPANSRETNTCIFNMVMFLRFSTNRVHILFQIFLEGTSMRLITSNREFLSVHYINPQCVVLGTSFFWSCKIMDGILWYELKMFRKKDLDLYILSGSSCILTVSLHLIIRCRSVCISFLLDNKQLWNTAAAYVASWQIVIKYVWDGNLDEYFSIKLKDMQ